MARTERTPEFTGEIPVFVPGEGGRVTTHEMGLAYMKHGRLEIVFRDNLPAVAIQRMIERGEALGVSFVMLDAEEETPETEEVKTESEAE